MIELKVTSEQLERAKNLYEFKRLNNSITEGDGNEAGALGEIVVCDYFKGIQANTFDYDLIIRDKKIDVKTKRYSPGLKPSTNWNLNIPDFNTTQDCNYYCFVGIPDDLSTAWLYGFIERSEFYKVARFGKKGELDPTSPQNWKYRADCYNILINKLTPDF